MIKILINFQTSIDVCDLIEESYKKFGHIENSQIEQLRLKYRLSVVQVKVTSSRQAGYYEPHREKTCLQDF